MKIGRNEPCPCGSGKKYKKCHFGSGQFGATPIVTRLEETPEIKRIREELAEKQAARQLFLEQHGIFINFVEPVIFKGKKVWVLGNRLYPNTPHNSTFHEFILHVLQQELGREWWERQEKLPQDEQHFIYKCFVKHDEWRATNSVPANQYQDMWRAIPDGYSRVLISLAFDVASLIQAVHLPDIIMEKIRLEKDYQSARYELNIAAIFARLGYKITFLDEKLAGQKQQPKHSEFIAANPESGEEIVIEVKSKQRKGVLHREGEFQKEREFRSSVAKLYRHALQQRLLGKPFIVFIDMNLPLSPNAHPNDIPWLKQIMKMRDGAAFSRKGKPSPTNAIFFTNYSYHYQPETLSEKGEWLMEWSENPEVALQDSNDFRDRLVRALHVYGSVPNLDVRASTQ